MANIRRPYASKTRASRMIDDLMDKQYRKGWKEGRTELRQEDDFSPTPDYETLIGTLEDAINGAREALESGDATEAKQILRDAEIPKDDSRRVTEWQAKNWWVRNRQQTQ